MTKANPTPMTADVGLPPEAVPEGTKGRILGAALQLFATRGFHGTSIRDIGGAVGLRAANLYLYYPSKEHLLAELVRLGHEVHHRYLRRALILGSGSGPVEQVKSVVRAHVRAHGEHPALVSVAVHEARALPPELLEPALVFRRDSFAIFTEVVQRDVEEGVFDVLSPELATAAISAMGVRVPSWYGPDCGFTIEEIAETYAEFAIRLLTPGSPKKRR
jgi:AcrR family transcriptional regulator